MIWNEFLYWFATHIVELVKTLRVIVCVTGTLVAVDSIGVVVAPTEHPPHKPKTTATAWLILSLCTAGAAAFLLAEQIGLVTDAATFKQQVAVLLLYFGLIMGFTVRAISRAHKPWLIVAATVGMTISGCWFILSDV